MFGDVTNKVLSILDMIKAIIDKNDELDDEPDLVVRYRCTAENYRDIADKYDMIADVYLRQQKEEQEENEDKW